MDVALQNARDLVAAVLDVIARTGTWLAAVLTWQVLLLIVLGWLFLSSSAPQRFEKLMRSIRSVRFGAVEIVANIAEPGATKTTLAAAFQTLGEQARETFQRLASDEDLDKRLGMLVRDHVPRILPSMVEAEQRWTIHVADIAFADYFYQLLDYYPTGGGAGRAFSTRYGIAGKAWRSETPEIRGDVGTDIQTLVLEWGMTKREADRATKGRPSFLCVPLRDSGNLMIGLLYSSAAKPNAFVAREVAQDPEALRQETMRIAAALEAACTEVGIIESLGRITREVAPTAPRVGLR